MYLHPFSKIEYYATQQLRDVAEENKVFNNDIQKSVQRFEKEDWGIIPDIDKKANEEALVNGDRIIARYNTSKGDIYIIADTVLRPNDPYYEHATILFCNEY